MVNSIAFDLQNKLERICMWLSHSNISHHAKKKQIRSGIHLHVPLVLLFDYMKWKDQQDGVTATANVEVKLICILRCRYSVTVFFIFWPFFSIFFFFLHSIKERASRIHP